VTGQLRYADYLRDHREIRDDDNQCSVSVPEGTMDGTHPLSDSEVSLSGFSVVGQLSSTPLNHSGLRLSSRVQFERRNNER